MNHIFQRILGKYQHLKTVVLTPSFPRIQLNSSIRIEPLGSLYGRKYVVISSLGPEPLLVSGGVGEDITFDVEFISQHNGHAILIDPTPRAIEHISGVVSRFGRQSQSPYSENGMQSPESYDLSKLNSSNFSFHPYAMLDSNRNVRFYEPPVREHVSYSVQNIQKKFGTRGAYIEVSAIGPNEIFDLTNKSLINVLKLDIEGSEYLFLSSAFNAGLFPEQILLEIDELHFPSFRSRRIAKRIFALLSNNNYDLLFRDGFNFTYVRRK